MRWRGPLALGVLALEALCATSAPAADLEPLRKSYSEAVKAWAEGDPALENDLFRRPAAEIAPRIDAAAARHAALIKSKTAYLSALAGELRAAAAQLRRPAPPELPAQDFNLGMLREVENVLSALAAEGVKPTVEPPVRALALQRLRSPLLELQLLLAERQRTLDRVPAPPEMPKGLGGAADALEGAAAGIEGAIAGVERDGMAWRDLTATMRREVARASSREEAAQEAPGGSAVAYAGTAVVPGIAGDWLLGGEGGQTLRVRIAQEGTAVTGSVETGPGRAFGFAGTIRSPYMRFNVTPPLGGWVVIQRLNASKIRLAYALEGAKKANVRPERIPEDKPVELTRAND